MRLSVLQRYILVSCYAAKGKRRERGGLEAFYERQSRRPSSRDAQNALTKSLERLIDKELLIGYGVRTPHKWYIKEIKLTPKGRKVAKGLLSSRQAKLPFSPKR